MNEVECTMSFRIVLLVVGLALSHATACRPRVWADGWHNAALATASLEEWLRDIKQAVPDIEKRMNTAALRAGRDPEALKKMLAEARDANDSATTADSGIFGRQIQTQFTEQERALLGRKARDSLEILAFMDPKNIFPREFPRFQLEKIPEYRKAAKSLLKAMGPVGADAVAGQVRSELMGSSPVQNRRDIGPHQDYYKDLLELLGETAKAGDLSPESVEALSEAAAGRKRADVAALANNVRGVIAESVDIPLLLKWHRDADDRRTKLHYMNTIRERIPKASVEDLAVLYVDENIDFGLKRNVALTLANQIEKADPLTLLSLMDRFDDDGLSKAAAKALASRSPEFSDLERDLAAIWSYRNAEKKEVRDAARRQFENAFLEAKMSQCLYWVAANDEEMAGVIWRQVDRKIAGASAGRLEIYRRVGEVFLTDKNTNQSLQTVGLELLRRMKGREAAAKVIDALPALPRKLWPDAGIALKELTGQDFGPKPGDGFAEVTAALKRWQQWLATAK